MSTFRAVLGLCAMVAALAQATPAAAQFSDAYNFIKAVKDKDVGKARDFLDKPGNTVVNVREGDSGDAALHIVVRRRDAPWLGLLLQANADANVRDRAGNTPLLLASVSGFAEGVRILLLVRAQVDLKNNSGETPLIKAVQARDAGIAKMLLDAGADPDVTDSAAGYSARDYALQDKRGGTLARLLKDAPKRQSRPQQGPQL